MQIQSGQQLPIPDGAQIVELHACEFSTSQDALEAEYMVSGYQQGGYTGPIVLNLPGGVQYQLRPLTNGEKWWILKMMLGPNLFLLLFSVIGEAMPYEDLDYDVFSYEVRWFEWTLGIIAAALVVLIGFWVYQMK